MALEIVTWGSGSYIQQALTVLSTMAGSSEWTTLARIAGVLGLLWVMLSAFKHAQGQQPLSVNWAWLLGFGFVYIGLMTPKVDVAIVDRVQSGCSTAPPAIVTDVPIGVAGFGFVTSQLGEGVTNLYEQYITIPGDQKYAQNGFLFGANMARATTQSRIMDSELAADTTNLMKHCVFPMIARGELGVNEVSQSTDLWNTIANKLPNNRWVSKTDGTVLSCKELGNDIAPRITGTGSTEIQNIAANHGQMMWPSCSSSDAAARWLASAGGPTAQDMLGINQSAADLTRQAMTINAMKDALGRSAAETDNAALAQSIYTAQAEETQRNTYTLMGNMAARTVPVMRAVLEALIYALFPIIMIFMLTPAWLSVISNYIIVMMWIQLWPPLYAVLNSIMYWYGSEQSQRMASMANGSDGLTMETIASVGYANNDMVALAGYMAVSIPIIAYMMIRGGAMAGSMLASGLTQPMSAAASRSGTGMTDASMQSNSLSWGTSQVNTATMNQAQTAANFGYGSTEMTERTKTGQEITSGIGYVATTQAAKSDLGNLSASMSNGIQSKIAERAETARSAELDYQENFNDRIAASSQTMTNLGNIVGSREFTAATGLSSREQNEFKETLSQRREMAEQLSEATNMTVSEADQFLARASVYAEASTGVKTPFASAAAGTKLEGAQADISQEDYRRAQEITQNAVDSGVYSRSREQAAGIAENMDSGMAEKHGVSLGLISSEGVNTTEDYGKQWAASYAVKESYAELQERIESQGVEMNGNLSGAIMGALKDNGYSQSQIGEMLAAFNTDGGDPAKARELMDFVNNNMGDIASRYAGIEPASGVENSTEGMFEKFQGKVPGSASSVAQTGVSGMNQMVDNAPTTDVPGAVYNKELENERRQGNANDSFEGQKGTLGGELDANSSRLRDGAEAAKERGERMVNEDDKPNENAGRPGNDRPLNGP